MMKSKIRFKRIALEGNKAVLRDDVYELTPATLALIRPTVVGVCSSDIRELLGQRTHRSDFGHEVVGNIVYTREPEQLPLGTRVTINPNAIDAARSTGFASMLWVEARSGRISDLLIPIPSHLHPEQAVFSEPVACAHRTASRLASFFGGQLRGARVAVFGAGTMGLLIGSWLRQHGSTCVLVNRTPERLSFAVASGLYASDSVCSTPDIAGHGGFDAVVLATAPIVPDGVELACNIVRSDGAVVIFGGTYPGIAPDSDGVRLHKLRITEATLRVSANGPFFLGVYGASRSDFDAAVKVLGSDVEFFRLRSLIRTKLPLSELADFLEQYRRHQMSPGKTIAFNDVCQD